MIQLQFAGWFQCRLATNPDPSDEPRGVSGYTFALPNEPDLDRIIRLQDPVAPRSHSPDVGVRICRVFVDGEEDAEHQLLGARVSLLDDPKFESRNLLLTDDRAGVGLIDPFHIEISSDSLVIRRKDVFDPAHPGRKLHEHAPDRLNRRGPVSPDGLIHDTVRISAATGITDAAAYRLRRKQVLEADLAAARESGSDSVDLAGLEKRISELAITDSGDMRLYSLQAYQARVFEISGPAEIRRRNGAPDEMHGEMRGFSIDTYAAWPIEFWMGGWDADALCGYISGMLAIPRFTSTVAESR